jgi:hypothetical protein
VITVITVITFLLCSSVIDYRRPSLESPIATNESFMHRELDLIGVQDDSRSMASRSPSANSQSSESLIFVEHSCCNFPFLMCSSDEASADLLNMMH